VVVTDELVDVVDADDQVVATVPRWQMRAQRLRHRAVFVAVCSTIGELLIHQRSAAKDIWPGRWDLGAGGVVGAGEDYLQAALRELAEEVGVVVAADQLVEIHRGAYVDDEVDLLARCYRVVHDGPFHFADGEVVQALWVDRDELTARLASDSFVPDSVALFATVDVFAQGEGRAADSRLDT
jgi:8-oxo-dGTP pyrophosphatase MutT (NUDIX family)